MAKVIPIRRTAPRPPDCERALALMLEAYKLLEELWESGQLEEGSPPAETLGYLDNAIGMLEPDEEDVHHG
jgi:hypothetical protein